MVFAKLQRRDIIRSMVKIHDLVDLAETPWRNLAEASTLEWSRDEPMDLDVADPLASPGEANLGLG